MGIAKSVGRVVLVFAVAAVAAAAGWALFLAYPVDLTDLFGVVLAVGVAAAGLRAGANLAGSLFPDYNVAEVAVEGPISRDGGGSAVPPSPGGAGADEVVEQIERADADRNAEALLVKLNTPGGEIVPSQDIRLAAERFDGPTVAYATDTCASGGYEIAAGCDELWAREGSIVGSIGVIGSRVNAADLADRLGVSYEQFTAGRFKDAGVPLKELEEEEREYLQTLVDDYYDQFVADVVEGRDLAEETVRETEARVYLGSEAADLGLVDELGTREDVEASVGERIGADAVVEEFEPQRGLADRLRTGAQRVAYGFGAGLAGRLAGDGRFRFE
ncbi:signal peptide peptidase SppA [Salinirussus salinus]|jgi:protease-4|uniref:signal peptide peptidase SppA n=1 Tax=Salinirussus salinus TaxID=1198300 RepID=UPI001357FA21|nr:signal peptide peptidase SppA [Salinirussus salinus]